MAARQAEADGIGPPQGRPMRDGRATAYVCRNHACDAPTTDPAEGHSWMLRAGPAADVP